MRGRVWALLVSVVGVTSLVARAGALTPRPIPRSLPPLTSDGLKIVVSNAPELVVTAWDRSTGALRWRRRLGGRCMGRAFIHQGRLFVYREGNAGWSGPAGHGHWAGEPYGFVIMSSSDGHQIGRLAIGLSGPELHFAQSRIYACDDEANAVRAVDAGDYRELWRYRIPDRYEPGTLKVGPDTVEALCPVAPAEDAYLPTPPTSYLVVTLRAADGHLLRARTVSARRIRWRGNDGRSFELLGPMAAAEGYWEDFGDWVRVSAAILLAIVAALLLRSRRHNRPQS